MTFGAPPTHSLDTSAHAWGVGVLELLRQRDVEVHTYRYVCGRDIVPRVGADTLGRHVVDPCPLRRSRGARLRTWLRHPLRFTPGLADHSRLSYWAAVMRMQRGGRV